MKIIRTDRGKGKTTELIKQSAKNGSYILCMNKGNARHIYNMSREMNLDIPYPITTSDLPLRGFRGSVLIDEIDFILPQLIGTQVDVVTTSAPINTLGNKNNIKVNVEASINGIDEMMEQINELQEKLDNLQINLKLESW